MFKSTVSLAGMALSGLLLVGGCAENITYSKDARAHGIKLYEQQDYTNAAGAFRNAVSQEPRDYESSYWLGLTYDKLDRHQLAMNAYTASLQRMDHSIEGRRLYDLRMKVITAMAESIASGRESQLEIGQLEARNDFDAYVTLAKIYRQLGDADSSIENYSAALNARVDNFPVAKEYAFYLLQLNQHAKATEVLKQAYRIDNTDQEVIDALSKQGIVVGPSLKTKDELARPLMPNGPLPDLRPFDSTRDGSARPAAAKEPAPAREPTPMVIPSEEPRD